MTKQEINQTEKLNYIIIILLISLFVTSFFWINTKKQVNDYENENQSYFYD